MRKRPAKKGGTYARSIETEKETRSEHGDIELPELEALVRRGGGAGVLAQVGYSYQPYAPGKCSVHITLGCDQDEATMGRAAQLALELARQYALDGMELIRDDVESHRFRLED